MLQSLQHLFQVSSSLVSKYGLSPTLKQARGSFLKGCGSNSPSVPTTSLSMPLPPSSSSSSSWVADIAFDELCALLGKSWTGTQCGRVQGEPMKEWMTSHVTYPDFETKLSMATYNMGSSIAEAMREGAIVLGSRRLEDGKLSSAVILSEKQGVGGWTAEEELAKQKEAILFWELGVTWRLVNMSIPNLLRCDIYQQQLAQSEAKVSALSMIKQTHEDRHQPLGLYWCIEMIGSDPGLQGQGYGKELLARICELADAAGMPCHLEAAGSKNARFYERIGFVTTKLLTINDPTVENGVPLELNLMVRLPKQTTQQQKSVGTISIQG